MSQEQPMSQDNSQCYKEIDFSGKLAASTSRRINSKKLPVRPFSVPHMYCLCSMTFKILLHKANFGSRFETNWTENLRKESSSSCLQHFFSKKRFKEAVHNTTQSAPTAFSHHQFNAALTVPSSVQRSRSAIKAFAVSFLRYNFAVTPVILQNSERKFGRMLLVSTIFGGSLALGYPKLLRMGCAILVRQCLWSVFSWWCHLSSYIRLRSLFSILNQIPHRWQAFHTQWFAGVLYCCIILTLG